MLLYATVQDLRDLGDLAADAGDVLRRAGVIAGQPFVLGPDGSYDLELNRFGRELDGWGVRSAHTVSAYMRDLMLYCRFLHVCRGQTSIWESTQDDLRAYKRLRRCSGESDRVSAATWNRFLAALDKWAKWAVFEGLLAAVPFRMVEKTVCTPRGLTRMMVNAEREPDEQDHRIRFVSYEDYLLWRDVGLRGLLPGGAGDPRWRGRHGERNAVFADLLVSTGMRLSEAASLLLPELPSLVDGQRAVPLSLSPMVTKRSRARTVFIPARVLRRAHHYVEIERDGIVARTHYQLGAGGGGTAPDGGWLEVSSFGRAALRLQDERRGLAYARADIGQRRRLMSRSAGPLWLWLGENGMPLSSAAWQAVFRQANARCAAFGLELEVHPHLCRHAFAVHMLGLLLRQTVRALQRQAGETLSSAEVKRLLIGDPLRKLQLLMGHRTVESTYGYLDVLDEAQEIVLRALDEWDEQASALGRVGLAAP